MCLFKRKKKPKVEIPQLPDLIEGEGIGSFELTVLNLIHDHRQSKSLKLAKNNLLLNKIATIHSKHMASNKKASHSKFPERDYKCRVYANAKKVKEIVAGGYGTAKGVVNGWLKSQAHRKAIEWEEAKEYGISIEKGSDNRNYYTVIFISK